MMPPDTADRLRRTLERLASNPRAVQTLARAVDFTEKLVEVVERREVTVRRAAILLRCDYDKAPLPEGVLPNLKVCHAGADRVCRPCRVRLELLEEFGL